MTCGLIDYIISNTKLGLISEHQSSHSSIRQMAYENLLCRKRARSGPCGCQDRAPGMPGCGGAVGTTADIGPCSEFSHALFILQRMVLTMFEKWKTLLPLKLPKDSTKLLISVSSRKVEISGNFGSVVPLKNWLAKQMLP